MDILLVERSVSDALSSERALRRHGHRVRIVADGIAALEAIDRERFDLVVTDWFTRRMDGVELVRRLRERPDFEVPILFLMESGSERARSHVLEAGADDCLAKPFTPAELLRRVDACVDRVSHETAPAEDIEISQITATPNFPAICIAASTGGPNVIAELLELVQSSEQAVFFVVLHGPAWMLERFQMRLQRSTAMRVALGANGEKVEPGRLFLAPGGIQMMIDPPDMTIRLDDDPPEHFMRPAADPMFRSAAVVFGQNCFGAVLTGLGSDGTVGAQWIASAGGRVVVQEPASCSASSMPKSVLETGVDCKALSVDRIAVEIDRWIRTHAKSTPTPSA